MQQNPDVQAGTLTNKERFSSSKGQLWHLRGWGGMHKHDLQWTRRSCFILAMKTHVLED